MAGPSLVSSATIFPSEMAAGTAGSPGFAVSGDTDTGLFQAVANSLSIAANGLEVVRAVGVASAVNRLVLTDAATGNSPSLTVTGTDGTVGLIIAGKSTGAITVGGSSATVYGLKVATVGSQAEGLIVTGAAAGANASITAQAANVALGSTAAILTTAVAGYIMINTTAGTPTGVPTGHSAGQTAMVYDSTGKKIWFYDHATTTWLGVVVA